MQGFWARNRGSSRLLNEENLAGMAFNTPVPFYDIGISCGNPMDCGDLPPVFMMMPDEVVGDGDVFCTRAIGNSMIGVGC